MDEHETEWARAQLESAINELVAAAERVRDVFNLSSGTPMDKLQLGIRASRALEHFETIEKLERMKDWELLRLPNFGRVSLNEVREKIDQFRKTHARDA